MSAAAEFDVIISGGGLVGASLACALASLPLRVALVEAVPLSSATQPSFDDRAIALSRTSRVILGGIGAWEAVAAVATPIRRIHVSERGRFGSAVISAEEQGVDALGHVVASRDLGAALWERVGALPGIEVFCPGTLHSPVVGQAAITVELDAGQGGGQSAGQLRGRLLVVADGARSGLRQALGIGATERSYGQTAVVGNVAIAGVSGSCTAYERFSVEGPLALLPFRDGRHVFVLARPPAAAEVALAMDEAAFLRLLQESFGRRIGEFVQLGRRAAYPLSLLQARELGAPRAVIIGNAAQGLHPVAGQGYNLGLRDVATLAEVVADALRTGADPGGAATLARHAQLRRRDRRNVIAFTDGLIRLFGLAAPGMGAARGAGLLLFDMLPGAKRALARHTMGMAGPMTRLARGLPL
ncbi:2-octaprenyl-6-methoxyphenol hydroxylase [Gammaproteobacteria bacterium]|nr:2-octaprenyl-6-methoxyphenol hydroxylase [Gammaproteobacteria bacterium]